MYLLPSIVECAECLLLILGNACREAHAFMSDGYMHLMDFWRLLQGKTCSPGVELALSRRGKTPTQQSCSSQRRTARRCTSTSSKVTIN